MRWITDETSFLNFVKKFHIMNSFLSGLLWGLFSNCIPQYECTWGILWVSRHSPPPRPQTFHRSHDNLINPQIAKNYNFFILWPIYEKLVVIFYFPPRRRPGTGDIVTPPVGVSVCPSVPFSFRTNSKTHCCIFSKLCRYSTNHVYLHRPNVCTCVTKHSNMFQTFLNWLKNSKRVWHEPKLHIMRLPLFANFDLWSGSVGWV